MVFANISSCLSNLYSVYQYTFIFTKKQGLFPYFYKEKLSGRSCARVRV